MAIEKDRVKANLKNGLITLIMPKVKSAIAHNVKVEPIEAKAPGSIVEEHQPQEQQQKMMLACPIAKLKTF
jgi:hypothetical protein